MKTPTQPKPTDDNFHDSIRAALEAGVRSGGPLHTPSPAVTLARVHRKRRNRSGGFSVLALVCACTIGASTLSRFDDNDTRVEVADSVTPNPILKPGIIGTWTPEGTWQLRVRSMGYSSPRFEQRALYGTAQDGIEIVRRVPSLTLQSGSSAELLEISDGIPDTDRSLVSVEPEQLGGRSVRWSPPGAGNQTAELETNEFVIRSFGKPRSKDELFAVLDSLMPGAISPTAKPFGLARTDQEAKPDTRWPGSYTWEYTNETGDGYVLLTKPSEYEGRLQEWVRSNRPSHQTTIRTQASVVSNDAAHYWVSGRQQDDLQLSAYLPGVSETDAIKLLDSFQPANKDQWEEFHFDPTLPIEESAPIVAEPEKTSFLPGWLPDGFVTVHSSGRQQFGPLIGEVFGTPDDGLLIGFNPGYVATTKTVIDGKTFQYGQQGGIQTIQQGYLSIISTKPRDKSKLAQLLVAITASDNGWATSPKANAAEIVQQLFGLPVTQLPVAQVEEASYRLSSTTDFQECYAYLVQLSPDQEQREKWMEKLGRPGSFGLGLAPYVKSVVRDIDSTHKVLVGCVGDPTQSSNSVAVRIAESFQPFTDARWNEIKPQQG
jgi:hypothetical protein